MNEREFEHFVLMQVKRSQSIHTVGRWVYLLFGLAGIVVFFIGIASGLDLAGGFSFLIASIGFLPASIFSKKVAASYADAAKDMEDVLSDPECHAPEDYEENTLDIRKAACNTLKSTRGLIISYGVIALACWAGAIMIVVVSAPGTPDFIPGIFALSFVLFTIAVILSNLTLKSIRDLPMARRYAEWLKQNATQDKKQQEE